MSAPKTMREGDYFTAPGEWAFNNNSNVSYQALTLPVTQSVRLDIAKLENGYILSITNQRGHSNLPMLCVGAESVESGVRAILAYLVTKELET